MRPCSSTNMNNDMNMKAVRTARMTALVANLGSSRTVTDLFGHRHQQCSFAPTYLRVCGILPWSMRRNNDETYVIFSPSAWYQWLVLLLAAVACAGPLHAVFEQEHQAGEGLCYSRACLKLGLLSDVPISLGSLFCL